MYSILEEKYDFIPNFVLRDTWFDACEDAATGTMAYYLAARPENKGMKRKYWLEIAGYMKSSAIVFFKPSCRFSEKIIPQRYAWYRVER